MAPAEATAEAKAVAGATAPAEAKEARARATLASRVSTTVEVVARAVHVEGVAKAAAVFLKGERRSEGALPVKGGEGLTQFHPRCLGRPAEEFEVVPLLQ